MGVLFGLAFSLAQKGQAISFGPVKIGEERIPINLKDFNIQIKGKKQKMKARWIKNSVQWVRIHGSLLTPRARLAIRLKDVDSTMHIRYQKKSITFQRKKEKNL